MKRIIQYSAIIIVLSLAASCNPIEDKTSEAGLISFEPQAVQTKALVNPDNVTGETFAVRDILNGTEYFNNTIAYSGGKWNYETAATYYWQDGAHKFFGYSKNGGTFDGTNTKWDISSRTITTSANQADLLYSSIFSTTAAEWKATTGNTSTTPVKLTFHHLLSAVRIKLVNATGADLGVKAVSVSLPNTGSASVNFAGSTAVPSVSVTSGAGTFGGFSSDGSVTVPTGSSLDVFTGSVLTGTATATPYVIWPQQTAANVAKVTITMADNTTKTVNFPAYTWNAGEINSYELLVNPKDLELVFNVMPWEAVTVPEINTESGSINMSNVTWTNTKVRFTQDGEEHNTVYNTDEPPYKKKTVYMFHEPYVLVKDDEHPQGQWTKYTANYGYYPAQGYFTVNYPKSGVFKIGIIAAFGETTVNANQYAIDIYQYDTSTETGTWVPQPESGVTITNNTVYFRVRSTAEQSVEQKAQIDIWFKATGSDEWISAYSEIRATYTLVIPAN